MKILHTAILLLFAVQFVFSQSVQVAPVQTNPQLRSHAAKEALQQEATVQQLIGRSPEVLSEDDRADNCPPSLDGYLVLSGESLEIVLDTFGLMKGEGAVTLTIENSTGLLYGNAQLDTTILLTYTANGNFDGAEQETVQIRLSQPGHDTLFQIEILVHRKPRTVVAETKTIQPESITNTCLDNELDFARPTYCSRSFDWPDDYDGEGLTVWHLSTYSFPDTCLVYYASRFPGVDTVAVRICDDWGVCDLFKIPYRIVGDTLSIASQAFFDDFSAYEGPYPTAEKWLDKDVYLNYTLAKDPPSVGLVTFDGLNYRGIPYDVINDIGDRLTSKAIDLSGYTASDNVSLRFFIAPKGYGFAPEITDVLTVEFRNNQREWVTMGTFSGLNPVPLDSFPPFLFNGIPVNEPQFLHDAFQFRFSAITSTGGMVDLWHIDYVQLAKNFFSTNNNFDDVAFTELPSSILKNYTSLPWRHFKGKVSEEITNLFDVHFYNHRDQSSQLDNSDVSIKETTTSTQIGGLFKVFGTGQNIPFKEHFSSVRVIPDTTFNKIITDLESIPSSDFRNLEIKYSFVLSESPNFYATNNEVSLNVPFSNYFAHDDGTAEGILFFDNANGGEQFATNFHAYVADTLKAVQIMFPHVDIDLASQQFNLKVWVQTLDTTPVLQRNLLTPFTPSISFDTLQGFTTYLLDDYDGTPTPVVIPANTDFFIGIQQVNPAEMGVPIGFDYQNICDCTWARKEGIPWTPLSNIKGAPMIRPVFGDTYTTSATQDTPLNTEKFMVFPNPTTGVLRFELKNKHFQDYEVAVFNQLGQAVKMEPMSASLDLSGLANGIYYLRIENRQTGNIQTERIMLSKD